MTLEDYSGPNLTVDKVIKKIGVPPGISSEVSFAIEWHT